MFDEKTILARLQNGEDAQKIADEMAAMINAANKAYAEQKAAEEAAKAAAAKAEVQKKEELQSILDLFCDWFGTYYDMDVAELKTELKADQVIELIDSLKEYMEAVKGLEAMFSVKNATKPTAPPIRIMNMVEKLSANMSIAIVASIVSTSMIIGSGFFILTIILTPAVKISTPTAHCMPLNAFCTSSNFKNASKNSEIA